MILTGDTTDLIEAGVEDITEDPVILTGGTTDLIEAGAEDITEDPVTGDTTNLVKM